MIETSITCQKRDFFTPLLWSFFLFISFFLTIVLYVLLCLMQFCCKMATFHLLLGSVRIQQISEPFHRLIWGIRCSEPELIQRRCLTGCTSDQRITAKKFIFLVKFSRSEFYSFCYSDLESSLTQIKVLMEN